MIKCPNPDCGYENVDGTQFCEMCGEELETEATANAVIAGDGDTVFCPKCNAPNAADNVVCEACGADMPGASAAEDDAEEENDLSEEADSNAASAPSIPQSPATEESTSATSASTSGPALEVGKVKLSVEQGMVTGKQYVLGDPEMLVGREDEDEDVYPDIDLDDQDEGYVHRRHATLKFENGQLTVTHLGGGNKTRVNNKPIPDNEPRPLKLGDKVSFGKVVLRVLPN